MWFLKDGYWLIGQAYKKGQDRGYSKVKKDIPFPDSTTNWDWDWSHDYDANHWTKAYKGLGVKGISIFFT